MFARTDKTVAAARLEPGRPRPLPGDRRRAHRPQPRHRALALRPGDAEAWLATRAQGRREPALLIFLRTARRAAS